MSECCKHCRFWEVFKKQPGKAANHGYCRRFPPTIDIPKDVQDTFGSTPYRGFPCTTEEDWCGEFQWAATVGDREMLTPGDMAKRLGITSTKVRYLAERGLIPAHKEGREFRFIPEEVAAEMTRRATTPTEHQSK